MIYYYYLSLLPLHSAHRGQVSLAGAVEAVGGSVVHSGGARAGGSDEVLVVSSFLILGSICCGCSRFHLTLNRYCQLGRATVQSPVKGGRKILGNGC